MAIQAPPLIDQPAKPQTATAAKVGRQGLLLISGFAAAQAFAFARNALIGHALSKGDFGIAATITITLQLIETLSDVGSDRLIVQSKDGDDPALTALAHLTLVAKGLITGAILYLLAGPMTSALGISHAQWAFEVASLVPVIKGFAHLDFRWHQRQLNNRPFVLYEAAPQVIATLVAWPALVYAPTFAAIPWIIIAAAISSTLTSHLLAVRPYRIAWSENHIAATLKFGWPIWLSAIPLVAVYQGDRFLIGGLLGMEALASFTTAFLLTMVPGLLAAKVGNALMLPVLSEARDTPEVFLRRFATLSEAVVILAAAYLVGFALSGGAVLPVAFGDNYAGLGSLVTILAMMWALRMLQAVPGMALMAMGDTRPLLIAGLVRAIGLPLAFVAAQSGYGLIGMALAGLAAEALSLIYIIARVGRKDDRLSVAFAVRCLALIPAVLIGGALVVFPSVVSAWSALATISLAVAAATITAATLAVALPETRALLQRTLRALQPAPTTSPTGQGASHSATGSI
ncbi:MAG: oligosaccharide flippase family protein [Pseudomonadota bacterium]